ncbi:uncharacterized protein KD926_005613 [Aspergillus affinis]|uniref:uncharacterized protein n=1 Tax=Aspergillus affinis TaxID=1070780 RepID=UPI0022FE4663|nr:uncharacterized protein KD926_005613 [Aspergillus affinis]KAI9042318.1 hypothetical protein KD926_005613 [Aspergillus affinis]
MESLPNELLASIGKYAQDYDFHALTLCSKGLRAVFLPFLFSSYLQRRPRGLGLGDASMIILLWRHPELATHVRYFQLAWRSVNNYFEEDSHLGDEFNEFIDQALDEIFEPEEQACRSKWRKHLQRQCEEAWKALLLMRLTHLQTLELASGYTEGLVPDILRKAAHRQRPFHKSPPFPYLRNVEAVPGLMDPAIGSRLILPFFYFPAVRTIRGLHWSEGRSWKSVCGLKSDATYRKSIIETPLVPVDHSSRPVRKLELCTCYRNRDILDWLTACTQLEIVNIGLVLNRDDRNPDDMYTFSAPELRQALLPFQTTLQKLHLGAVSWRRNDPEARELIDSPGPMGSLKEFTVLRDLKLPYAHLLRPSSTSVEVREHLQLLDILPVSIRTLSITDIVEDDFHNLLLELLGLLQQQASSFPPFYKLERIQFYVEKDIDETSFDLLIRACDPAGIVLAVEVTPVEISTYRNVINF